MNNKKLIRRATIIALLIFFLFFVRIPVIELHTNHDTYFIINKQFTLSWIHSVEKEAWYEVYINKNNKLVLTETYFKTFGAGVPSDQEILDKKDGFIHMKVNRELKELNVIVSENVKTTITAGNKDIELYKIVEPYTEVNISSKKLYLWNLFEGEFL